MSIWGIDISVKCTGWVAGLGADVPNCGAWFYAEEDTGADYGLLLELFRRDLEALAARHPPTHITYEAPLLMRWDKLQTLRRTYGLGAFLELWGRDRGAVVEEEDPKNLKRRLTGNSYAEKSEMVRMARQLGVQLPKGDAAKDAADAFAAWLIGLQHHAKHHLPAWDQKLYGQRGRLL